MQPLHQEIDPSESNSARTDQPGLQRMLAEQAVAHAEEVRLLRQRIAVLESALAAANADATAQPTAQDAPAGATSSEFSEPLAPAVASAQPASNRVGADQGFADAWDAEDESSFEERIAQKAFFQVGSVDEESRKWLLAK